MSSQPDRPRRLEGEERQAVRAYLQRHTSGVLSTIGDDGRPQSAFVDLAVTPDLEIVFETLASSRKFHNIERDRHVALVIGWDGNKTAQIEGVADEVPESRRDDLLALYRAACPRNARHEGWPGLTYVRVRPRWIRVSDYGWPWHVDEFTLV